MTDHLLSLILFFPLAGMLMILLMPNAVHPVRIAANVISLLTLCGSVLLVGRFQGGNPDFQFVERATWIPAIGAQYLIGIDGISLLLLVLTTLMSSIALLASWNTATERPKLYYAMILLLETGVLGVFVSLDLFLFYLFWDLVLIPMYFIIGVYGGPRRSYAAMKFFLYTLLGSVFLLLGFLGLYFYHAQSAGTFTFELTKLIGTAAPLSVQIWIFWALFLGFAVKVPMFPLHTWLPDAHVEAPTAGSVLLASLLLKMGTYGFIRFSLPLVPAASSSSVVVMTMVVLSLVAIIYGALVSLMQSDWKRLVAYSSVSHLGFCTLGIFALNFNGLTGSVIQQVNHGISTGLLFLIFGFMYDRRHTREISDYGGIAGVVPVFATVFAITVFSSAGLPLLNGFIGEFTVLSGAFAVNRLWAVIGVLGIVLSAAYQLWLYQRTMMGPIRYDVNRSLPDLTSRERLIVFPLIALTLFIGLYPAPLFSLLRPSVTQVLDQVRRAGTAR